MSALFKPEEEKTMTFGTYFSETENSNDSTTTLEMTSGSVSEDVDTDTDSEHLFIDVSDHSNSNGNNNQNHNNGQVHVVEKRKQRRRERNRRSAQAYRKRRRQQTQKVDETLDDLLQKNQLLRQKMNTLEDEKTFIIDILKKKIKIPWPYPVMMPYPTGMWSTQDVAMSTPIYMDSVVPEVTVAS